MHHSADCLDRQQPITNAHDYSAPMRAPDLRAQRGAGLSGARLALEMHRGKLRKRGKIVITANVNQTKRLADIELKIGDYFADFACFFGPMNGKKAAPKTCLISDR